MTGWIVFGVLLALSVALVVLCAGLVKRRNRVEAAWSQVDLQLRRRAELVPDLVEAVQGRIGHGDLLEALTTARATALGAKGIAERDRAEQAVTTAVRSLFTAAEASPDLEADPRVLSLQEELSATVGRITYARRFYNHTVSDYNARLQSFPTVMVAGLMRARVREHVGDDSLGEPAPAAL